MKLQYLKTILPAGDSLQKVNSLTWTPNKCVACVQGGVLRVWWGLAGWRCRGSAASKPTVAQRTCGNNARA